jgi:hypothetical protein
MTEYILERFCDNEQMGAFGRLLKSGVQVAYTVEQPYRDNKPFVSCVPAGRYELVPFNSPKYGRTVALRNHAIGVGVNKGDSVRYACLIHAANRATELQGCIALGDKLGCVGGDWAILNSKNTVVNFLAQLKPGDTLTIINRQYPPVV